MKQDLSAAPQAPEPSGQIVRLHVGTLIVDSQTIHRPGCLVFQAEQILAAGGAEVGSAYKDAVDWHAEDYICAPGLINAHTHAPLAYLRGLGHGQTDMIEKLFFATESKLDETLLEPLSYSYIVDGLRGGVTCFADHYYFIEGVAAALERLGARGAVAETIQDIGGPFSESHWPRARKTIENWPFSRLVQPVLGPHATDTLSPKLLKEVAAYGKQQGLSIHMHLSQTHRERDIVIKREGKTPVAVAEACGALGPKTLAVHLVATDAADWELIQSTGTTVGLCPASQIIYEQLAPLSGLLAKDTPAALGNDCAASNDSADLLGEARVLGLVARQAGVPLSPQRIFDSMTRHGADVFGLPCGRLHQGLAPDFFLCRHDITLDPMAEPLTQLIYSGSNRNVEHVMVNGKWVLFNRQLQQVTESDLRREFLEAVKEIHQRVGGPHASL